MRKPPVRQSANAACSLSTKHLTSLCLALTLSAGATLSAANYGKPRQTYVPASLIDRRVDLSTLNERNSNPQTPADLEAALRHASDTSALIRHANPRGSARVGSRYGSTQKLSGEINENSLVPPPPPYPGASLATDAKAIQAHLKHMVESPETTTAIAALKRKAQQLATQGNIDQAKQTLTQILQLSPHEKALGKELAKVSADKARLLSNSKEFDKAVHFARQTLAFDGTSADARKFLDNVLTKTGVNAGSTNERLHMAHDLARQGHYEEAEVEYRAAVNIKPNAEGYVGLGNLAMQANQREKAKVQFQKALELEPNYAAAHRQFGTLKYLEGEMVAANSELSRTLILDPHDQHAASTLIELWRRQIVQVPGVNSHLGLARAYQLSGDLDAAQAEYRAVVQMDPNNPHLPACRQSFKLAQARQQASRTMEAARTLEQQGAYEQAYDKIYEAVGFNPGDADLHVYEGQLLEKLNRVGAAKQAYMNALNVDPRNVTAAASLRALPAQAPAAAPPLMAAPTQGAPVPAVTQEQPFSAPVGLMPGNSLGPTPDPVANLSNFAVALRNQMFVQKGQMQQIEDSAHRMLKTIGTSAPPPAIGNAVTETASLAGAGITGIPTPGPTPGDLPPVAPPLAPVKQLWSASSSMPVIATPPVNTGLPVDPSALKPMLPVNSASGNNQSTLPATAPSQESNTALSTPAAVRLELAGATPQATGVNLDVILSNDSDHPLLLPKALKARIKYSNRHDAEVKPVFESGLVPSHGQIHGNIKVPFDKVDPTADLLIPGLLPPGYPNRDIHLTTSLASR